MRRRYGFTLVELLVVMAIISILLTIAAPRYLGNVDKAKEAVLRQNLSLTRDALEKFKADTGKYPKALDELVERRYLRALPIDPIVDRSDRWITIPPPGNSDGEVFDIKSSATGMARDGTPYSSW